MPVSKYYANKGVERNKKPLKNIVYEVNVSKYYMWHTAPTEEQKTKFETYRFKNEGYLSLTWWYETDPEAKFFHGMITPESLKAKLGERQWAKFCQGKRVFVIQRRVNGRNISKT